MLISSKPRNRRDSDLVLAIDEIRDIVKALNRTRTKSWRCDQPDVVYSNRLPLSDMQIKLRLLVSKWMKSGPNLRLFFKKNRKLAARARYGRTVLYPRPDGRGHLEWFPVTPESHLITEKSDFSSPKDQALRYFMALITNFEWASLAGPCPRCEDYFLKETRRTRVYCSKACSSLYTATSAVKRMRERNVTNKIKRAQAMIDRCKSVRERSTWKKFLLSNPEFTSHWITRAVKSGRLQPPSQ